MKYRDGTNIRVGDRIRIAGDDYGLTVVSIDTNEYSPEFPEQEWNYLKKGILIKSEKVGLVHYDEYSDDIELLKRK